MIRTVRFFEQFDNVLAFQSTREGGLSKGEFSFANMSLKNGDNFALHNRLDLAQSLCVELDNFVFSDQTHSKNVHIVSAGDKGRGAFVFETAFKDNDAFVTDIPGIMIIVTVADCVPILLYDVKRNVIAAVHSGWRGTVKKILTETLTKMKNIYGSRPEDIFVTIGSSIGVCCYEVGDEVVREVREAYGEASDSFLVKKEKYHFDLWKANSYQAEKFGVPQSNIFVYGVCTSCANDKFYSARRGDAGRQIAGIMLKP